MRRRSALFLNVLIVLGLILSGQFAGLPISNATSTARVAAPAGDAETESAPALASKRANRKQDLRRDRKQDRQRDRAQADRKRDDKQKERKQDRKRATQTQEQGRVEDWREFCTGPDLIPLLQVDLCTHGPDPAPPGYDASQPLQPLSPEAASDLTATIACDGDNGSDGFRVQVLYVHASDVTSQYDEKVSQLRALAAEANQIFQNSAADTLGSRALRFVQDPITCEPTVLDVEVSSNGDDSYSRTMYELGNLEGFNSPDRIYLSFVDASMGNICGVGNIFRDDRADSNANLNNVGPSHSLVYCWTGAVAAHELMHNLGGVQLSAPNTSGGFHCIDEWDVMCYRDSSSSPPMRFDCADSALNTIRFDCGHNDYFNANPEPGSYLARCWNPANNRFLIGATPQSSATPCTSPPPPPSSSSPPPPDVTEKKDKKDKKDKKGKSRNGKGKKHKKRR